eukprot:scaffold1266_cov92-Isochrysis_galbana.AAC.6
MPPAPAPRRTLSPPPLPGMTVALPPFRPHRTPSMPELANFSPNVSEMSSGTGMRQAKDRISSPKRTHERSAGGGVASSSAGSSPCCIRLDKSADTAHRERRKGRSRLRDASPSRIITNRRARICARPRPKHAAVARPPSSLPSGTAARLLVNMPRKPAMARGCRGTASVAPAALPAAPNTAPAESRPPAVSAAPHCAAASTRREGSIDEWMISGARRGKLSSAAGPAVAAEADHRPRQGKVCDGLAVGREAEEGKVRAEGAQVAAGEREGQPHPQPVLLGREAVGGFVGELQRPQRQEDGHGVRGGGGELGGKGGEGGGEAGQRARRGQHGRGQGRQQAGWVGVAGGECCGGEEGENPPGEEGQGIGGGR